MSRVAGMRRVFGNRAGPTAIGILVPPGARTAVVVRPRSLPWDLLVVELEDAVVRFCEFGRGEAEAIAEELGRALDAGDASASDVAGIAPAPGAPGHCVRVEVGRFRLVADLCEGVRGLGAQTAQLRIRGRKPAEQRLDTADEGFHGFESARRRRVVEHRRSPGAISQGNQRRRLDRARAAF